MSRPYQSASLLRARPLAVTLFASIAATGCPDPGSGIDPTAASDTSSGEPPSATTVDALPTTGGDTTGAPTGSSSSDTTEGDTTEGDTTIGDTTVGDTTVGDTTVGDTTVGVDTDDTTTGTSGVTPPTDGWDLVDPVEEACFLQKAPPNITVSFPSALAVADFDGDGAADVAVRKDDSKWDPGAAGPTIARGEGDGRFAASTLLFAGESLHPEYGMITVDLDGDGALDLATVSASLDRLFVHINLGDGTFAAGVEYPTSSTPETVAAGDFDEDGDEDLVLVHVKLGAQVWSNDGVGGLSPGPMFDTESVSLAYGHPTAVADLDGDGHLDLAIASHETYAIEILRGDGSGTFAPPVAVVLEIEPSSVVTTDLDGDGDLDLAVGTGQSGEVSSATRVLTLLNAGDATFAPPVVFAPDNYAVEVELTATELDGDGFPDLVAVFAGTLAVMLGQGDGSLAYAGRYSTGFGALAAVGAKIDGDDRTDLVVSNRDNGTVNVLLQQDNGTFGVIAPRLLEDKEIRYTLLADLDDDGFTDVVASRGTRVWSLRGTGDGEFALASDIQGVDSPGNDSKLVDVDLDGDEDLVFNGEGKLGVMLGGGDGTLGPPIYSPTGLWTGARGIADFDGDGKPDVALHGPAGAALMKGAGDGKFALPTLISDDFFAEELRVADFGGDGKPDLLVSQANDASKPAVHRLRNLGGGAFDDEVVLTGESLKMWPVAADLDGDGDLDLAVQHDDTMHVLLDLGGGVFGPETKYPLAVANGGELVPADLDGDGDLDIVAVDQTVIVLSVSRNNGDGTFQPAERHLTHTFAGKLLIADITGDGALDLVVAGGGLSTLINDGSGGFGPATSYWTTLNYGIAGDDVDGDGRTDLFLPAYDGLHFVRAACR